MPLTRSDPRVSPVSRVLGAIVGAAVAVVAPFLIHDSVTQGFNSGMFALGIGAAHMAYLFLRTAVTGRDPYLS